MLLHYTYANRSYSFEPKWNDPDGHSVIFREIVYHLKNVHGNIFSNYADHAYQLDLEVDKLYEYIYIFNDEYKALPYNPKHKKQFLQTFENIYKVFEADVCARSTIESSLIVKLFPMYWTSSKKLSVSILQIMPIKANTDTGVSI